jgi:hypothetical protein
MGGTEMALGWPKGAYLSVALAVWLGPGCGGISEQMTSSTPVTAAAPAQCPPLPSPVLVIDQTTAQGDFHLLIANATAFPDALFVASPDLPPCGANPAAARAWVDIRDVRGPYLYGYCGIRSAGELASGMFLPGGLAPPEVKAIVVVVYDRKCGLSATSNEASLPGR